jgi:hypothetical protein
LLKESDLRVFKAILAAASLVVSAGGADADTPPASGQTDTPSAAPSQAHATPEPVRRRHCVQVIQMGSNYPRRNCAMYTDEEWAALRETNRETQRQTNERLDDCDRGGAMPAC